MDRSLNNHSITINRYSRERLNEMDVFNWPIWEKNVSKFDWEYDTEEQCYIIEGLAEIETPDGVVTICQGDFVTFCKGLKCKWHVKEPIKKHYNFL